MLHLGNHSIFSEPQLTHLQNGNNNIYSAKVERPLGQAYKILDVKNLCNKRKNYSVSFNSVNIY